jgi:hypothetical protein
MGLIDEACAACMVENVATCALSGDDVPCVVACAAVVGVGTGGNGGAGELGGAGNGGG